MKNMKKLLSLVLAMVMVFAMTISASAASITITGGATGSEYAAYKLLNATDGGDGKVAYTLNEKYADILKYVTQKETREDIVDYIEAMKGEDKASDLRDFADAVYAAIKAEDPAIEPDYTSIEDKFDNVDQGYYLIAETKVGNKEDTFSLVMLDTAGKDTVEVATKEDAPSIEKKVEEKNDSTGESSWGDSADYDIGDTINYEITGTVSSKYEDYASYDYKISDKMDDGLTLNQDSIKIMINGVDVTSEFVIVKGEHSFEATANLKKLTGVKVTADSKVVVTYKAILNEDAVSGTTGNKNTVDLDYENDPYYDGTGETPHTPGSTPEDVNIVFTFDAIVNKVDKDGNALEGAGFTLYKWDASVEKENKWVVIGKEITDKTTFIFEGLDAGKYKLVETTVPGGYNRADDIEFEVVAVYDTEVDPPALKDLSVKDKDGNVISIGEEASFSTVLSNGEVITAVVNLSGTELPSTGGMGTTLFYAVGGLLVLVAVVTFVTRKRMDREE